MHLVYKNESTEINHGEEGDSYEEYKGEVNNKLHNNIDSL